ncbi:MAG: biotin--[acetyl-CoA-carboxylase] ligase [Bacteriovorax sp.]|nr:biotin--[acetyl-CoA-carboxylase] ligase [Bacteriovorax sp.]
MYHKHFNSLVSTQIYLKDNLEELRSSDPDVLISCSEQTNGIGRQGNKWETYPNSLAMSFTLKPNPVVTLSPIEIGIMSIKFIHKQFDKNLFLKWPNDILTREGRKCGGIICQYIDNETIIAGLGINLGKIENSARSDFRHGLGSVNPALEFTNIDQELISSELYTYFLSQRISQVSELQELFIKHCIHINKKVSINDDQQEQVGIFKEIGKSGEAIIEIDSNLVVFFAGSLTILN